MVTANAARAKNRLYPVLLFDIVLLNGGGTINLSDRTILIGSTQYQEYILNASEVSAAVKRETSRADNPAVSIIFNNKAFRTYANLSLIEAVYPLSGATITIKETYLDDNNVPSDTVDLFVGVFEEIKTETVNSFTCVAMNIKVANSLKNIGSV